MGVAGTDWNGVWAALVHTAGYLLVTGTIAVIVYERVGRSVPANRVGESGPDLGSSPGGDRRRNTGCMRTGVAVTSHDRLPQGQALTRKWPVLTYGDTPEMDLDTWAFRCFGLVDTPVSWTWQEFLKLPRVAVTSDIHCVTRWSRFDNEWEGVAVSEILRRVGMRPEAMAVMVHAEEDYTTNLLLSDIASEDALLAIKHDGKDLPAEHGGSVPPGGAQALLLEERQVGHRFRVHRRERARLLGGERLPPQGRSLEGGALFGPGDRCDAADADGVGSQKKKDLATDEHGWKRIAPCLSSFV